MQAAGLVGHFHDLSLSFAKCDACCFERFHRLARLVDDKLQIALRAVAEDCFDIDIGRGQHRYGGGRSTRLVLDGFALAISVPIGWRLARFIKNQITDIHPTTCQLRLMLRQTDGIG